MTSPDENRIMKGTVRAGGVTPRQPPPGSATPQTTMIDPLRIQYFAQRLRGMADLHLEATLAAMLLGRQERPSRESAAFFAARIAACEREYERRGLPVPVATRGRSGAYIDGALIDRARRVMHLRDQGLTQQAIADQLGVGQSLVSKILLGIPRYARAVPPEVE